MNNEPVAWMNKDDSSLSFKNHGGGWQPLYLHPANPYQSITDTKIEPTVVSYTHPVKDKPHPKCDEACMYLCQMRELTDEEIEQIADDHIDWVYETGFIEFARAILRKAQE